MSFQSAGQREPYDVGTYGEHKLGDTMNWKSSQVFEVLETRIVIQTWAFVFIRRAPEWVEYVIPCMLCL